MTTLNDFKALRDSVPAEVQGELYRLFTADPEASYKRMVEIAAEKSVSLTVEEVKGRRDSSSRWMKVKSSMILNSMPWLSLPSLVAGAGEKAADNPGCFFECRSADTFSQTEVLLTNQDNCFDRQKTL